MLAEIRARDAAKGRCEAGVTMTPAERDRRMLLALLDEALAGRDDALFRLGQIRLGVGDARRDAVLLVGAPGDRPGRVGYLLGLEEAVGIVERVLAADGVAAPDGANAGAPEAASGLSGYPGALKGAPWSAHATGTGHADPRAAPDGDLGEPGGES